MSSIVDIRGTDPDQLWGACDNCTALTVLPGATVYDRCDGCRELSPALAWAMDVLGYAPRSIMFPDYRSTDQQGAYLFQSSTDAMLFRVAFGVISNTGSN